MGSSAPHNTKTEHFVIFQMKHPACYPIYRTCGRVVNTPASYSGGEELISRSGDRLRAFVVILSPSNKCRENRPTLN
jgi:hypothetical protein